MRLYMIERSAADPVRSAAWYAEVLGLQVTLRDEAGGFVLLEGAGLRLGLKRGEGGGSGDARLSFLVDDLEAERSRLAAVFSVGEVQANEAERYREFRVADPDGRQVRFFAWGLG